MPAKGPASVHVVEHLAPGGIETLVLDLVRGGTGADAIFSLTGTPESLAADWPALAGSGVALEAFDRGEGFNPGLVPRLARAMRARRPSTVFVHHIGPLLYGGMAARLAGVGRLVHVEHDAWHYEDPRHRRMVSWLAVLLRPEVVAVSEQVADRVRTIMPGRPVRVIPPGIRTERFRPRDKVLARRRLGLDESARIVGTAGRLVPVKGHLHLIDAMAGLPDDVRLVIAGDGPERGVLEARAAGLGLGGRVRFLGHRDDLEDIYPALDVFCLPSLAEGLPRTVLEAQACGVPVVASAVGGLPEAVEPVSGRLVPSADPAALAAALADVLARNGAAPSPRRFVEERLSWTRTMEGYRAMAEA